MVVVAENIESHELHSENDAGEVSPALLSKILLDFRSDNLTGRATFSDGNNKIDLSLTDGNIVYVASNDPDKRLGELLLKEGKIRLRDYQDSVQALLETGQKQGDFLLEKGRLQKNELKKAVREHMRELVYWLLSWNECSHSFRAGHAVDELIQLHLSTSELILRGAARCTKFSTMRDMLAPWSRTCNINSNIDPDEAKRIRLKEDEASVINLVNGELSVSDLVKIAPMPDFRAMQLVYALQAAQIIQIDDPDDLID